MNYINKQQGDQYYRELKDIIEQTRLTAKERVPKYRSILDNIYKKLTSDVNVEIRGLAARMSYISQEYKTPWQVNNYAHELRKYANKIVHESGQIPTELEDVISIFHLAEVIRFFSKTSIPTSIQNVYHHRLDEIRAIKKPVRKKLDTYAFTAVVLDVFIPRGKFDNKYCTLTCNTDDLGIIKLSLWNNKNEETGFGSDLTPFGTIVKQYQNIHITEVKPNLKNDKNEFYATEKSLLVLEPDYLVDAKELASCMLNSGGEPLMFLVNQLSKSEITERILVGDVVGHMLDDLSTNNSYNYTQTFKDVMQSNSFGMLNVASDGNNYNKQNIEKIYLESQGHERTLKKTIENYPQKNLIVEPTFISADFGIQGRLDLLIENRDSPDEKDIIELKSSRNPPSLKRGTYSSHKNQALCYDLLLSSTYPNRRGRNYILYSGATWEETPLRDVPGHNYLDKQNLLMLRNEIVSNELKMATGNMGALEALNTLDLSQYPDFIKANIERLLEVLEGTSHLDITYLYGFLKFVFREIQVAKIGSGEEYRSSNGYADLWKSSKEDKIQNYNVLTYLEIQEINDERHIELKVEKNLFSTSISTLRVGDAAMFYPTPDTETLSPLKSQILKCRVLSIDNNGIRISLIHKQINKNYFKGNRYWAFKRDFSISNYKKMLGLNFDFISSDTKTKGLIYGLRKPEFNELPEIEQGNLNDTQYRVVRKALATKDYLLIQGPPGTGKTSAVLTSIVQNLEESGSSIMILAFTNKAVKVIGAKLSEKEVNYIRMGRGKSQNDWTYLSENNKLGDLHQKVKETRVFISTQSSFINNLDLLKFKDFDMLVIDESSQLLEPQLNGIIKYFKRFVMIGDDNQLPAVVLQSEQESTCNKEILNNIGLFNYRESLFARLVSNADKKGWDDAVDILDYHYRMHEEIADFPNKNFYNNKLIAGTALQKSPIPILANEKESIYTKLFTKSRVVYVPTGRSVEEKLNEEEGNLILGLIDHIKATYGNDFDETSTVGIITPFRAQISKIREVLDGKYSKVEIDTVERFQGGEKDIIIISYAINKKGLLRSIQSINSKGVDRKLNVALTRAKKHLIILGTEQFLELDKNFNELITFIKTNNGYFLNPQKTKDIPTNLF